jgi:hypothetical protein
MPGISSGKGPPGPDLSSTCAEVISGSGRRPGRVSTRDRHRENPQVAREDSILWGTAGRKGCVSARLPAERLAAFLAAIIGDQRSSRQRYAHLDACALTGGVRAPSHP